MTVGRFPITSSQEEFPPLAPGGSAFTEHTFTIPGSSGSSELEARLSASFYPATGEFSIVDIIINPDYQNHGRGKTLLEKALSEARRLDASVAIAREIISRECLDAMRTVFGAQHIEVYDEGEYGQENTDALLKFPISGLDVK